VERSERDFSYFCFMAIPKTGTYYSPEEYLALEEVAEFRSEYFRGEIFAMAGATANHGRISLACARLIGNALENSQCELFSNETKLRIPNDDIYYYPEFSALCGTPDFEDSKETILKNPALIIEVLSESTESYDRGKKFHRYKQIPSFREYVLIAQDEYQIDVFEKNEAGNWTLRSYEGIDDVLELDSLGIQLKLADIYRKVKFT
jgi:Uma2 family endonuclease